MENSRNQQSLKFYLWFPVVITIVATLLVYVFEGFEDMADLCIFVGILMIVESLITWGMYKVCSNAIETRKRWVEHYEKKEQIYFLVVLKYIFFKNQTGGREYEKE